MKRTIKILSIILGLLILVPAILAADDIKADIFTDLKARSIGPANMSGRIGAIDAVNSDPNIIYVGTATGGLWKSTDGGLQWKPIMDSEPVSSIGAVAINQSNPDIVWIGTGEATPRNSVGVGRGVYLTIDAGKTWKFLGLEKTEKISKILLHPTNPAIAYVGALGATWGDSEERGVYKTMDFGKTWEKILYVNEKTGVADMAMSPANPNKIVVGMWEHRRWPWFFKSGGKGSGLYMTVDCGKKWKKLTDKEGMPKGELGRIGIAFAKNKPNIIYALVEAKKSVMVKSIDGGYTWTTINDKNNVANRPFYYHRIWVNPVNEQIIYMLHSRMMFSEDGGKSFTNLASSNQAHADHHAMWVHPEGELLVAGNDGGVVISQNRGMSWRFVENMPLGQFYHVSYDMEVPYNVYGGLQDNGSWRGPGYMLKERSIYNYLWKNVGWGDGFDTEPDPEDSDKGYGMSQGGSLYVFDVSTGLSRGIVPTESDVKHRYSWNAGFAVDPFKPATIYLGSQFVHRSPDKGQTWEIISPDLTTNDSEKLKQAESGGLSLDVTNAENHCTIVCIAPSPVKEGIIWVSTDDGNLQLTQDNGKTWSLVSGKITTGKKGKVPAGTNAPHIEASKHDAATAYAVFENHQRNDWTPYVYVTRNYGKTWKSLVTSDIDGFTHCIEEDHVDPDLLFVGTEFGLFFSTNGGTSWAKWTNGLPTVPVRDIAVHPRENDLIIGTHGRSIYIIDDISPLREISEQITQKTLHLFSVPEATMYSQGRMSSLMAPGNTLFEGENKRQGAYFSYYLIPSKRKARTPGGDAEEVDPEMAARRQAMMARFAAMGGGGRFGRMMGGGGQDTSRLTIIIKNGEGKKIHETKGTEKKGLNRVYWTFREDPPSDGSERRQAAAGGSRAGGSGRRGGRSNLTAFPGDYTVTLKYDDAEVTESFTVKPDPRFTFNMEIAKENRAMALESQKLTKAITSATSQIEATKKSLTAVTEFLKANRSRETRKISQAATALEKKLKELTEKLNPTPAKQGIADRSAGLRSQMGRGMGMGGPAGVYPISQAAKVKFEKSTKLLEAFLIEVNAVFEKDVEEFKKLMNESGFSLFKPFKALEL